MVKFDEDSYTITVRGDVGDYLTLQAQLLDLLRCVNPDMIVGEVHYAVIDFLKDMQPPLETAIKMAK